MKKFKRILIIQTASIGDVILSTPLIEKLFHYYPNAKIDFLLKEGYEEVLRKHPKLHFVIVWDKNNKKYRNLFELIKILRENQYDLIVNAQRFFSSGLITVLSGARITTGFNKNPLSIFFSHRIKHLIGKRPDLPHETERNLMLIERYTGPGAFQMKLYPSKHDYAKVSQFKTKRYITISPASLWFTKQFPADKWVEFLKQLNSEVNVYLLGSVNEVRLCNDIIKESGRVNCMNLAGKLSILESTALMENAVINYVNDSAPMHMASSVNGAVAAIYCSTVPEFGFGPKSSKSIIIQTDLELECRPCGLHGFNNCPKKHFDCATSISIEQLVNLAE